MIMGNNNIKLIHLYIVYIFLLRIYNISYIKINKCLIKNEWDKVNSLSRFINEIII